MKEKVDRCPGWLAALWAKRFAKSVPMEDAAATSSLPALRGCIAKTFNGMPKPSRMNRRSSGGTSGAPLAIRDAS